MTREEAKEILENWKICHYTPSREAAEVIISALDPLEVISALRGPTREQVEKVWRAHWNESTHLGGFVYCSRCGYNALEANNYTFCPKCGSPFTDEAVQMVMERLEELNENRD